MIDDLASMRLRLLDDVHRLCVVLGLGKPARERPGKLQFGSKSGSLQILTTGAKAGLWYDYQDSEGGDLFTLIARQLQITNAEAIRWARDYLGDSGSLGRMSRKDRDRLDQERRRRQDAAEAEKKRKQREKIEEARRLWRSARPAAGTIVETYLREARGIPITPPASLRFAPSVIFLHQGPSKRWYELGPFPCMVGLMTRAVDDGRSEFAGVHRTWLAPDGSGKADLRCPETGEALDQKRMLGPAGGAAIRFDPPSANMVIGEGIETTLSVKAVTGGLGETFSFWAAGSLGNISGRGVFPRSSIPDPDHPGVILPPMVWTMAGEIVVLGEREPDGSIKPHVRLAIDRACRRWSRDGVEVSVFWANGDHNDLLVIGEPSSSPVSINVPSSHESRRLY